MPADRKTLCVSKRSKWRAWLQENADTARAIWLVFYKKHVRKQCVSYDEAVEEALCFGWVDSIVRRIDADGYAQKFTPRKPGSAWSDSNVRRAKHMIAAGKMTAAGLAAFAGHEQRRAQPHPSSLPPELEARFRKASRAWKNFERFPPGYRRMVIGWVASAKRDETRRTRLDKLIQASARCERLTFI